MVVGCSLAPHTSLLMPFSGSTGRVVHPHGLTGSRKAICVKADLDIYTHVLGVPGHWTALECGFNFKP